MTPLETEATHIEIENELLNATRIIDTMGINQDSIQSIIKAVMATHRLTREIKP